MATIARPRSRDLQVSRRSTIAAASFDRRNLRHGQLVLEYSKTETSNCSRIPVCARLRGFAPVWRPFAPVLRVKLLVVFAYKPNSEKNHKPGPGLSFQKQQRSSQLVEDDQPAPGKTEYSENSRPIALSAATIPLPETCGPSVSYYGVDY